MASEKGLAGHDKQELALSWIESQSQKHERTRFDEILAGLCCGQVRPQRGHASKYAGTTEVRVLLTVMDKAEGWNEEEGVGLRLAACMWIYTKAELCDGRGPTQENRRGKLSTIMESVSWVCEDALRDHEWVTELNAILKENEIVVALNYDLETLTCPA